MEIDQEDEIEIEAGGDEEIEIEAGGDEEIEIDAGEDEEIEIEAGDDKGSEIEISMEPEETVIESVVQEETVIESVVEDEIGCKRQQRNLSDNILPKRNRNQISFICTSLVHPVPALILALLVFAFVLHLVAVHLIWMKPRPNKPS